MAKFLIMAHVLFMMTILNGCSKDSATNPPSDDKFDPLTIDCVPGNPNCAELSIQGDAYYRFPNGDPSPFSGFADPTIRKDPVSGDLWLAYSWPHYKFSGNTPVPSVDIHLAKSTDGGNSFVFMKTLWEKTAMVNPGNGTQQGFLDHETANLLPVEENGSVTWYAARLNYFIPETGGFAARPFDSFHISVLKASSPEELTVAPVGKVGTSYTHANWNAQPLMPADLASEAFFWNEPSLYYQNDKLYLILVAFVYRGVDPYMPLNNVYVYSTTPSGDPNSWQWSYNGKLVDDAAATELGGERLSQTDIATGANGELLLISSPDDYVSSQKEFNHKGCKIVEIESLENPELARYKNGSLKIKAIITASDANALGSGASAYDAASTSGILFTRRNKTATELTASIWRTGLKP
ncbi:MAG: exo-alpha-sialidase [Deferribacteres bacterium]|nr:exo-alpha-sialidase [candidate division KSB1 bacterium]MCB9502747.1 exo-alpha-sialidase [Deferribacteres bacterium]